MSLFLSQFNKVQLLIFAAMVLGILIQLVLIATDTPLMASFLAMPIALGGMAIASVGQKKRENDDASG